MTKTVSYSAGRRGSDFSVCQLPYPPFSPLVMDIVKTRSRFRQTSSTLSKDFGAHFRLFTEVKRTESILPLCAARRAMSANDKRRRICIYIRF
jgi:hypothetical protein